VLSLTARGVTTGEVAAHFADVYGASVSKDTISTITDEVLEEMTAWRHSPLDRVYPVVFIDAIVVKVRDGQAVNPPVYVAIGVTTAGERDILGRWAGDGGEGAKHWLQVLTEIKNRGVEDVCILVCDGLRGLPDSVGAVWRPAPPPGRQGQGRPDRGDEPGVRVGGDQPDAGHAAGDQVAEEGRPAGAVLGAADLQAQDLAVAVGVHARRDERVDQDDQDDPAAFAGLHRQGVRGEDVHGP
jgi:hypothetical protein